MRGARKANRLTVRSIDALKEPGRYADGNGLYFAIRKGGSRQWIFLYKFSGKAREMGLGSVNAGMTLAGARVRANEARAILLEGHDPIDARKEASQEVSIIPSFGTYAMALLDRIEGGFSNSKHRQQWRNTLTTYCRPIWNQPINQVDTAGVLACITQIWSTKPETAGRVRGRIERVLNAAKAERLRTGENPALWRGHLDSTLPRPGKLIRGHHAALAYSALPTFMAELRRRDAVAGRALEFLILTSARTSEVLGAMWAEIDLDTRVWTVPARRMKARREHRVPLSDRAIEIVEELGGLRSGAYVFPGHRPGKELSNMALLMLLKRMGRSDVTAHGFRSAFADWASEISPFGGELREAALAHVISNKAEAAYRRGDALEKRRKMMDAWAAYLLGEKESAAK